MGERRERGEEGEGERRERGEVENRVEWGVEAREGDGMGGGMRW